MKSSKLFHGENEINAFSTEHAAQAGIYVRRQMGSGSLTVLESLETEIENSNFLCQIQGELYTPRGQVTIVNSQFRGRQKRRKHRQYKREERGSCRQSL